MTHAEALDLLGPAIDPGGRAWADLGAGAGTFTRVIADLIDEGGVVIAVDREARALRALARLAEERRAGARVEPVAGDISDLGAIGVLSRAPLDGALFANALHFLSEPESVLSVAAGLLRSGGRLVVIEYERRTANRWVPHPLPLDRLGVVAVRAGLPVPQVAARRPSAYHGEMYCAAIQLAARCPGGGEAP